MNPPPANDSNPGWGCHKYNIWPQLRASAAWVWISHQLIVSRIWESQPLLSARFSLHQIRQPSRVLPNPSTFDNPRAFEPSKVINLRTFEPSKVINLRAFNLQPSKGTLVLQPMRDLTQKGSGIHPDNTSHSSLMPPRPIQPNHSTHQYIQ